MKDNIRNKDKNGEYHGEQIDYHSNGNIQWIRNYHHGKPNGYRTFFNQDKTISFKQYWNMNKWIYKESHWTNQIQIKI